MRLCHCWCQERDFQLVSESRLSDYFLLVKRSLNGSLFLFFFFVVLIVDSRGFEVSPAEGDFGDDVVSDKGLLFLSFIAIDGKL